jgi:membrane fusion protein (multidrug efflux system)
MAIKGRHRKTEVTYVLYVNELLKRPKRLCLMSVLLAFGVMLLLLSGCKREQKAEASSPPTVEVADIIEQDVPVFTEWIASADGSVNATIRAQVEGYLIKQNYREGDFVNKGQILFEIDPRPFQAALDQANAAWDQAKAARNRTKASLEQARADVAQAEARYFTASANLKRVRPLAEQNAVSQKDLDDAVGADQSAEASVKAVQAAVSAAQAAAEKAQLDLGFTRILSPVDGIAGIAKAQIGNLVGPGSVEELTTVSTVDPIKVYIPMSEQEYLLYVSNGHTQQMPLHLILADGSTHPYKGVFAFADRQVDVRTGTIKVAALFPNPGNILRPGQFARVRAESKIKKGALLVPQRAVMELQGSYQVAVVGSDNKIDIRPVKVAERINNLWVIDEGLKPKERVIAEGIQKIKQGMVVNPKPFRTESKGKPEVRAERERKSPAPARTEER